MRPLDGLVVLDLTRLLPGAAATMQLANFGAEVIKIEEPGRGDYGRGMPPYLDGQGAVFHVTNRGKKSVAMDLKSAPGHDQFLQLAGAADILVESFRPGAMERLSLGYSMLSAINPRLIHASITGYGPTGPWAAMAGHDINFLAMGGGLDLIGTPGGPPAIPGLQIADLAAGALQAVNGILLALAAREKTGRGQKVEVSMRDGIAWLLPVALGLYAATGEIEARGEGLLTGRYACYHIYQAACGRWLAVGALEPKFWQALCRGLGCEHFIPDHFAEGSRREEVIAAFTSIFRERTAAEWLDRLHSEDCCVTPVLNIKEVAEHYRLGPGDSVVTPRLSETPGRLGGTTPHLGEHTAENPERSSEDGLTD